MASNVSRPAGCGPAVSSIYYKLCDLDAAWGVVLEASASAGVVVSLVLFTALLANVPFTRDPNRRNAVALHALFLVCTAGLFGLTFAFVVGKNFSTCASRRFLFGVLFAGCFSCLLVQGVRLNALARTNRAPGACGSCLVATALWSVEVLVNAEWLIITVARHPPGPGISADGVEGGGGATAVPCDVANADFAMALIYVMALLVAALGAGLGVMAGEHKRWKREGALILACALLSVGIWAAWIAVYVHGNFTPRWDDPALGVALVTNAWVFLALVTVPQVCCSAGDGDCDPDFGETPYPGRGGVGYENILKELNPNNVFAENMDNKAFSVDEPAQGAAAVSPYSGYTGQLRSCVYQPTELALIAKARAAANPPEASYDSVIPRASARSEAGSVGVRAANAADTADVGNASHGNGNSQANASHRTPQW
ncbi:G-protein coupled receptor family C group 5 member C isoform X2 [Phyllopteryx taeniolatus]|uniref:G-protein coupled receptor family C group 5 member C isoform X2 n=1 Tax=Phyllopteryx taeniolatus TaxID=161469 RepID=UPI002AD2E3C0|nr:G-protein coupled receptor family C group 5 member C isoform X2 [Phyllopteryx taeniolatus]